MANVAVARVSCILRVSTAGGAHYWLHHLGGHAVHIFAELAIKPEENAEFENAQIEVPVRGGVGGGLCAPSTPQRDCSTRQATQGRGGFNRYRAFRLAGLWSTCCEQYAIGWSQHLNKEML